jgi:hypothetical protein
VNALTTLRPPGIASGVQFFVFLAGCGERAKMPQKQTKIFSKKMGRQR